MPILKVSNDIKKYALEVVRIPISPLGDCPQCQSNGYRDGICPDCTYVDPNVLEAIQEWQAAMGIQQVVKQQLQGLAEQNPNAKAAYRSLAFPDLFPSTNSEKTKCPICKKMTMVDGTCEDRECWGDKPPKELGFKRPDFLGIDPEMLKNVKRNFPSPASLKIEKNNKKLKKKSAKGQSMQEAIAANPGARQDDSMNASMDATTRMKNLLQQNAQVDSQNHDNDNDNANNSEEL